MIARITKLLQHGGIILLHVYLPSCKPKSLTGLIANQYSNIASVYTNENYICYLIHYDPGGIGGGSYELYTCDIVSGYYEVANIRDFDESMPIVDSIVNGNIYIRYNFESNSSRYQDRMHGEDVFLDDCASLKFNYKFCNQRNNCGNRLISTQTFDSFALKSSRITLYCNEKLVYYSDLNLIQFPYKKRCIEYFVMNDCIEEYQVLEADSSLDFERLKHKITTNLLTKLNK